MSEDFTPEKILERIASDLHAAENRLGLTDGTLQEVVKHQDCITVILMIATIETTLNELNAAGLRQSTGGLGGRSTEDMFGDLTDLARDLPLDGGRGSKVEFALRLKLIEPEDADFIRALASLRNRYAHNIRNMEKSIKDVVLEMMQSNGKLFARLTYDHPDSRLALPPHVIKFIVVFAFSTFLDAVDRKHKSFNLEINSLLGFMADPSREPSIARSE